MSDNTNNGWEPSPDKMGNWRSMFEHGGARHSGREAARGLSGTPQAPEAAPDLDDGPDPLAIDPAEYKPWILQRGRSRPTTMLHLRRFEPKSGKWVGWLVAYYSLIAVEYIGDKMLSLDFGTRQFVIEGEGLTELARHLQDGTVLVVQEYAPSVGPASVEGGVISSILHVGRD